nr:hypothetical protein HEP87_34825 [Streptomyces sp. S1D4-11]
MTVSSPPGRPGGAVELDALLQISAYRLGVRGAQRRAAGGLRAQLEEGEMARAVADRAGRRIAHERQHQGAVARPLQQPGEHGGLRREAPSSSSRRTRWC